MSERHRLRVDNFAQIRHADIEFGDLTVLVGPQATGKSLLLELLKLGVDHAVTSTMMKDAGLDWDGPQEFIEGYLGEGMKAAWRRRTQLQFDGFAIEPGLRVPRMSRSDERLFYIPAQRSLLLVDGWPLRLERLTEATPFVARLFSDALFRLLASREASELFPATRLKEPFRVLIDEALYHGGTVKLVRRGGRSRRLEIVYGSRKTGIPFQGWSAGQREFTPLLLGLYRLLPGAHQRTASTEWVVIEEPEMGLHPRGIEVVMLLVLELLHRGYRVVLSTHSPIVLEVIWGIQRLARKRAGGSALLDVFQVEKTKHLLRVAHRALGLNCRVFALDYEGASVLSHDISGLDPAASSDVEAFWGGLTRFGSRIMDAVAKGSR